ncbi:His Kinase A (phosphoacceptor) domain [Vibrio sp. B1FLJ16]|uniref:ATP-binding protein n=1 Tax=Vibrio sp. B1FLJ16 TaxID=2751178 RepID=UPI0015F5F09F|nr:ATP-binding protein [Vibrio sp. B1FLJ16]CAD7800371.1 His Kinase A (phosphoacceptor) domain [Vibrio sp. B1FLJ16]CAE6887572.1 His Kinase A (phosphoacceptor) domain [Vibrio sp. B1FLJ16]
MKKRHSIATKIFLLFALSGSIAGGAVLMNFFTFYQVADSVEVTVHEHLPVLTSAAKIAHIGGMITTDASKLASADSVVALTRAHTSLKKSLPILSELSRSGLTDNQRSELLVLVESLETNIANLFANSQEKLRLRERQDKLRQQLYWLQVDFVDEVAPLTSESQYNLSQLVLGFKGSQTLSDNELDRLATEANIQAQLLKFESDVNLVFDLLQRVPLLSSRNDVLAAQSIIDENMHAIEVQISVLKSNPSTITLRQMAKGLEEHISGSENTLDRSLRVLVLNEQNQALLEDNRQLIQHIKGNIDQAIVDAESANRRTTAELTETLAQSRAQLALALLGILTISISMAWYLKYHLLLRLAYVLRSMRYLAAGEPQSMIHVSGKDEVSSLADATNLFNYQSQELRRYTKTLEETNQQLVVEIQQRKRAEQTLKDTQDELIQAGKLAVLGQLTTGIVHEFSQPLAAIRSNSYLAEQYLTSNDVIKAGDKLTKINNITDRATKLCQHLKSFARKTDDDNQSVALRPVIENALELFTEKIPSSWVELDIDDSLQVMANEVRLEQVIVNLLSNSIEALDQTEGEVAPKITISASLRGDEVKIKVVDNGCGIEKFQLKDIFEPFFTTKDVGKGLGLGMSITHNIIQDFGGSIHVTSQVNQGTEVTLCLKHPSFSLKTIKNLEKA